jgi:ribonuclease D
VRLYTGPMTILPPLPVEFVNQPSQLDLAVKAMLDFPVIAMDTESNSFHRYPEQLCLIQIATLRSVYIIDTIVLKDLAPLKRVFEEASIKKIIHGADYDVRCLDRHYGFRIRSLYDTSIAARFSGVTKFGLGALIEDLLSVTINKSKRLQRADWGLRPLSSEALEYAAADVRYLFALKDILDQRLQTLGRMEWVAEEYVRQEEVRYNPPDIETAYLSLKGVYNLDARGLAIARSLFQFRDQEARRRHRPPFFVMPDDALVTLAASPNSAFSAVPGLGQSGVQQFGPGLRQAIRDGQGAPPVNLPPYNGDRLSREQMQLLTQLKAWRSSIGISLSLDPSLLWPTASLERLARSPDTLEAELASPDVRRWQYERFASSLRTGLKSLS